VRRKHAEPQSRYVLPGKMGSSEELPEDPHSGHAMRPLQGPPIRGRRAKRFREHLLRTALHQRCSCWRASLAQVAAKRNADHWMPRVTRYRLLFSIREHKKNTMAEFLPSPRDTQPHPTPTLFWHPGWLYHNAPAWSQFLSRTPAAVIQGLSGNFAPNSAGAKPLSAGLHTTRLPSSIAPCFPCRRRKQVATVGELSADSSHDEAHTILRSATPTKTDIQDDHQTASQKPPCRRTSKYNADR
jgi:hypothetical protein